MQASSILARAVCSLACLSVGCASVTKPSMPSAEMPSNMEPRTTPPVAGTTRVVLDANGQDALVSEVLSETKGQVSGAGGNAFGHEQHTRNICLTPCIVDLTPGLHTLQFQSRTDKDRSSTALVQVGDRSLLVRHEMAKSTTKSWATALGWVAATLGTSAALTGAGVVSIAKEDDRSIRETGSMIATVGVGLLLTAIPLVIVGRPKRQESATAVYAVASAGPARKF